MSRFVAAGSCVYRDNPEKSKPLSSSLKLGSGTSDITL